MLFPSPLWCWDGTQGFMHARQGFHHSSTSPESLLKHSSGIYYALAIESNPKKCEQNENFITSGILEFSVKEKVHSKCCLKSFRLHQHLVHHSSFVEAPYCFSSRSEYLATYHLYRSPAYYLNLRQWDSWQRQQNISVSSQRSKGTMIPRSQPLAWLP